MSSGDDARDGVRAMLMRGGTSKGAYFLARDLPADGAARDDLLLRIMGSPDPRQIDGIGGAHPLTSKVAVVSRSAVAGVDLDYLFLQVMVDAPVVTDQQNCGNILAGVGPFAVERGLVPAGGEATSVRIRMVNTDSVVTATFPTPGGRPRYDGDTAIDGVPGTAAPVVLNFEASPTGDQGPGSSVLPTGNVTDTFGGITVTCVNNGMPVVVVAAASLGKTGQESIAELEADAELNQRVLQLRLEAGKAMGLGDVSAATVPKISLVAPPTRGGTISTRTFIPVRVHESIGVLGAVSVGTAVMLPGAVGSDLAVISRGSGLPAWGAPAHHLPRPPDPPGAGPMKSRDIGPAPTAGSRLTIEHPSGALQVEVELDLTTTPPAVHRSGVVRTARKLFDGTVFPR